jgi:PAS domain-containing protein
MVVYKVNPSFSLTLGYPEDMEGSHSLVLFIPMILIKQIKKVQSTTGKTISFENRYRKVNGEYVSLSWNVAPDPVTGKLYCTRDVTLINKQKNSCLLQLTLKLSLNATDFQ